MSRLLLPALLLCVSPLLFSSSPDIRALTGPSPIAYDDVRMVPVRGLVRTRSGNGIRGAYVKAIDASGSWKATLTNELGHFRFDNLESGATYTFTASHQRYRIRRKRLSIRANLGNIELVATR